MEDDFNYVKLVWLSENKKDWISKNKKEWNTDQIRKEREEWLKIIEKIAENKIGSRYRYSPAAINWMANLLPLSETTMAIH